MNTKTQIKRFEKSLDTIRAIARVFQNATTKRMNVNQEEIAKITRYKDHAQNVYSQGKMAAINSKDEHTREMFLNSQVRKVPKKQVLVLISSEKQYFGSLIDALFNKFATQFAQNRADAVIVGAHGRELFEAWQKKFRGNMQSLGSVKFYPLNNEMADFNVVHQIVKDLVGYMEITVFYGHFESVFRQDAKSSNLVTSANDESTREPKKYLFVPSWEEPLAFLEEQIIAAQFLERLYESGLAKYGYRVKILQIGIVSERISSAVANLAKSKLKVNKSVKNKKQNEVFAASNLWKSGEIVNLS